VLSQEPEMVKGKDKTMFRFKLEGQTNAITVDKPLKKT
jgi:hypothetical protein